jgi:hypothetical protein
MKLNESGSGPRFDPGQVHHKEINMYQVGETLVYSLAAIVIAFAIILL